MSYSYLIKNFFTNKDFLLPASQIPGTLFTPLHFLFSSFLLVIVVSAAIYIGTHKKLIKPVFIALWLFLLVFEVVIITWESLSAKEPGFDLQTNLSLYPCSLFLYTMPFIIWGKGDVKKSACGYLCTLGLVGAAINFIYPGKRLAFYSCISFVGFHTFLFHGGMLFACMVLLISGIHRYTGVKRFRELILPCIPTLLLSIPANIINFSPVNADYMFFKGEFPPFDVMCKNMNTVQTVLFLYLLYIVLPALFYLPSYLRGKFKTEKTECAIS